VGFVLDRFFDPGPGAMGALRVPKHGDIE